MHAMDLFEYAVIRYVPRVEREEFVNIGVVLYCRSQRFIGVRMLASMDKCRQLFDGIDTDELSKHMRAFRQIVEGIPEGRPIADWEPAERFRWLTAKRSTIIQTSPVHPGMTGQAEATLVKLYDELVG